MYNLGKNGPVGQFVHPHVDREYQQEHGNALATSKTLVQFFFTSPVTLK